MTRYPGAWWYDGHEIDVAAPTTDGTLLLGECKFTSQPLGYDVLAQLEADAERVRWTSPDGGDPDVEYVLFARSGFAQSVREATDERAYLTLVELSDVIDALEATT